MSNDECKQAIIKLVTEINDTWLLQQILRLINNLKKSGNETAQQ